MAKSFNELAADLRDFIIEKHSNYKGLKSVSLQRYNNLTLSMNPKRYSQPHVIIKVGISEGVFAVPYANKIDGGLGMDERFAMQWIENGVVATALEEHWKNARSAEE
ncbi:hypothetical protein J6A31_00190 [bacterium]|nr:hypothetical protein [bacterium]